MNRITTSFILVQTLLRRFVRPLSSIYKRSPCIAKSIVSMSIVSSSFAASSSETFCNQKKIPALNSADALELDKLLMSEGGFSLDQLMELAGLSVASACVTAFPPSTHPRVLIVCGPGNNGGDGLVAARHLVHFGYSVTIIYPKRSEGKLFQGLVVQCKHLGITFLEATESVSLDDSTFDFVIDAIFGFSFKGKPRPPFDSILAQIKESRLPLLSVDM